MNDIDILLKIFEYLFDNKIIRSQKEFAEIIGESKVGWNDIKKGKKKVSIIHLRHIASRFKEFNRNYIFMGEGALLEKAELNNPPVVEKNAENSKDSDKSLLQRIEYLEMRLKMTDKE